MKFSFNETRIVAAFILCSALIAANNLRAADKPNVLLIMTDDQGYPELSCHGNPVLQTPALDRLHDESVRLTDFHVAPMCTPTRGQLLTGQDAIRNRASNVSSGRTLLKAGLPTIADHLAGAGYSTGLFGKWHLGDNYPFRPQDRGFNETIWFPSSHINSTPDVWDNDYFDDTYSHNGHDETYEGYCTDVFFSEGQKWIENQPKNQPWFAYIALNAAHWPWFVPSEFIDPVAERFDAALAAGKLSKSRYAPKKRMDIIRYLAMVENIDANIRKIDQFLTDSGLAENTIVVFLTDNGSTMGPEYYNAGMRGKKTQLWEGGHRVPCFIRYPNGHLGPPRDVGGLTHVQDLAPTLLELCDVDPIEPIRFDGISLVDALRDEKPIDDDRTIVINYSRMPFKKPVAGEPARSQPQKDGAGVLRGPWRWLENRELYNVETDPLQTNNVAAEHPTVVRALRAHLDRWWNELGPDIAVPERVIIGSDIENPSQLTACEWLDVFIDQQVQVRRADLKNGIWHLQVDQPGRYTFELRRWPEDCPLGIAEGCPPTEVTDGTYLAGKALPIAAARIRIGGEDQSAKIDGEKPVRFDADLDRGQIEVQTWFQNEAGEDLLGAYYLKVTRR